ncbi:M3 family metallopeptidase [Thalassotalea agarivorans]|nr:M3 family metallopeptidase [Thalassotalea agarivorans]
MKNFNIVPSLLLSAILMGCSGANTTSEQPVVSEQSDVVSAKAQLLAPWEGPYQGVPAFDKVNYVGLDAAFDEAMALHLAEIETIAQNPAPATFENTVVAMEKAGKPLRRLYTYYGIWRSNMSSKEFREISKNLGPKLSAYGSKINQNEALFKRIQTVYEGEEFKTLNAEQQRLTWLTYNGFAHYGATLSAEKKKRYADINQELSVLHTQFANNVLADEENYVVFFSEEQTGGLPQSYLAAASKAAEQRGKPGMYAVTNTRSSMSPFLTYSTERALREQVWNNYYNRGDNGDEFDNNENIAKILQLRHERVQLLGYENYASWRLQDRMAKTPENAMKLMTTVWPYAIKRVEEEVEDMAVLAEKLDGLDKIEPWDYRYYSEKVRKEKYDLDSNEVKQYLELDNLREAMFYVAGRLFDFSFKEVSDGSVPVFHPDVRVWEVTRKSTGENVGLWYLDPFARQGKRSGAWATSYRSHTTFEGKTNVLSSNNSNFVKGVDGQPTLISWDDAETYFHEFGHSLHALSSNVTYPSLNGGVRDYTEFQSQLLERWLTTDEVIDNYLVHYKTGEPMPAELIAKIKAAANFNQGFKTTEYLASALVDMKFHMTDPKGINADKFEYVTLTKLHMPTELVMRHRSPHFGHIFSGEGYAAAYYGYMWADVLTSDAAQAFEQAPGGYYDEDVAKKLVEHLFSVRNAVDPADAYRAFRGRDAQVEALLKDRGFIE